MAAPHRVFSLLVLLGSMLLLSSCADDGLSEVYGRVTLDGEPLPDAFVRFYPQDAGGSTSSTRTDANGEYVMEFSQNQTGVIPGNYIVRIETGDIIDDRGDLRSVPERVPVRYNKQSELTCTVTEDGPNEFDFDLESEGEIVEIQDGDN